MSNKQLRQRKNLSKKKNHSQPGLIINDDLSGEGEGLLAPQKTDEKKEKVLVEDNFEKHLEQELQKETIADQIDMISRRLIELNSEVQTLSKKVKQSTIMSEREIFYVLKTLDTGCLYGIYATYDKANQAGLAGPYDFVNDRYNTEIVICRVGEPLMSKTNVVKQLNINLLVEKPLAHVFPSFNKVYIASVGQDHILYLSLTAAETCCEKFLKYKGIHVPGVSICHINGNVLLDTKKQMIYDVKYC